MREILFRGKRTGNEKWICGHLLEQNIPDCHSYIVMSIIAELDNRHIEIMDFNINEVIPETVGQFTGLTDKNGVKIFEGDIVRYGTNTNRADNKEIHEVVFETRGGSGYFGIRISEIETWNFCLEVPAKLMEVIGNIHDNPELLGGENNGINR